MRGRHQFVVGLLAAAVQLAHLVAGPNFVLDDWFAVRGVTFGGWAGAIPAEMVRARPGAFAGYAISFGLAGNHPVGVLIVQSVLNICIAILLYSALRKCLGGKIALTTSSLWILLPNHVSLEVWGSAVPICISLLCVVGAANLLVDSRLNDRRRFAALAVLVIGSLSYEAALPLAAAMLTLLPRVLGGRFDRRLIAGGVLSQGAVALWLITNWSDNKQPQSAFSPSVIAPSHFGWGIVGRRVGPLALAAVLIAVVLMSREALRNRRVDRLGAMVIAGLALMGLGTLPFVFYFYSPIGAGDRVLYISSIGGALIISAALLRLWQARAALGLFALAALAATALVVRGERVANWDRGGNDALAILDAAAEAYPIPPAGGLVFGPEPIVVDGVAAFLDNSNVEAALQILYGRPDVRGFIAQDRTSFATVESERSFDIRPYSTLTAQDQVPGG